MLIHDDGDITFVSEWNGAVKIFENSTIAFSYMKRKNVKIEWRVIGLA